jgi:hypothetical protein
MSHHEVAICHISDPTLSQIARSGFVLIIQCFLDVSVK